MLLGARFGMESACGGLPYDAEVEWLGGVNGKGPWINTGITNEDYPNLSFDFRVSNCSALANSNVPYHYGIFGVCERQNGYCTGIRAITNGLLLYSGRKGNLTVPVDAITEVDFTIWTDVARQTMNINGTDYSFQVYTAYDAKTCPICLYCYGYKDTDGTVKTKSGYTSRERFHYFRIFSNGEIVRDLIPVRKDGVGYMYDKISGQLFGNAAYSGAFIIGPDKV